MIIVIIAIFSAAGVLGMTFFFPLLAAILSPSSRSVAGVSPQPDNMAILIPAHNEEELLPITLRSITEAIQHVKNASACTIRVLVGADGCTDNTQAIATSLGAEVIAMPAQTGKWSTISTLVSNCKKSQWIILADSGVTWPRDFLVKLLPLLTTHETIGVAPTYRNDSSGFVERVVWGTERAIKAVESMCGGPVSVHGATVCYRTEELTASLQFLSDHHWLNDDVVIPLCLRALHPSKKLRYASHLSVNEAAAKMRPTTREFIRRRRLVLGNIQWIQHLWGPIWRHNYIAAILASRRVFRLLWGYWAVSAALTLALHVDVFTFHKLQILSFVLLLAALFSCVRQLRTLFESGLASLLAPYYFVLATLRSRTSPYVTRWN